MLDSVKTIKKATTGAATSQAPTPVKAARKLARTDIWCDWCKEGTSHKADSCWKNPASGSYRPEYAQAMAEKDRKIASERAKRPLSPTRDTSNGRGGGGSGYNRGDGRARN